MNLSHFNTEPFPKAIKMLFAELNIPINPISEDVFPIQSTFVSFNVNNPAHALIDELYAIGTVDDQAFKGVRKIDESKLENEDYDFIMVFGIKIKDNQHPTRSQLAEITRLANASFNNDKKGNPVTVIYLYGDRIALANTDRQARNSSDFREGEKLGKVSLLRDVKIKETHTGHLMLLKELKSTPKVIDFKSLYQHWQVTFSVSLLNKKFYGELQNWYFWALQEVHFPNPPLRIDFSSDSDFDEALKEHKGKNVIRLLTRILFIWFIKEKGLIPEEIFDEKIIADRIINEFVPQKPEGLFLTGKQNSKYYRAILQNLFFATLNQPCKQRDFRTDGKHQNVTQLMRYKSYFKDPGYFIELMEAKVPFMNGGLFECLDKPHETLKGKQGGDRIIYVDGFSDKADNDLLVPDFLFFDADEEVDLSKDYGNTKYKKSKTRGLITILKSYKFTITENTPIDEEVALDPELLGKVFENLLASYNPETKTTARKQTGSFYTPREIVDYMVDESLIAYLKNHISAETEKLDEQLHQLVSYSSINPFAEDEATQKAVIKALDKCTILDPACGSGAYPMGILQKMVHILHKIDPNNTEWKNRQLRRVDNAIAELEQLDDNTLRESTIRELELQKKDIEESFTNNELDYGRKLYLIENCIFGVDIQPIATQISKLRFFISLVVDQKVDAAKDNFGVRPLPNLETKFVAANTLIGIDKPNNAQTYLFDRTEVQKLEKELKKVRQGLFSAKTPSQKRVLREQDKTLRVEMGDLLEEEYGNATARQLANWDPYDQNTSSPFFDKEWMFDIREGFDIVIGNPPYLRVQSLTMADKKLYERDFKSATGAYDLYILFTEKGFNLLNSKGQLNYIQPDKWINGSLGKGLRKITSNHISKLISFKQFQVFNASTYSSLLWISKKKIEKMRYAELDRDLPNDRDLQQWLHKLEESQFTTIKNSNLNEEAWTFAKQDATLILDKINKIERKAKDVFQKIFQGIATSLDDVYFLMNCREEDNYVIGFSKALQKEVKIEKGLVKLLLKGDNVHRYKKLNKLNYVIFPYNITQNIETFNQVSIMKSSMVEKQFPLGWDYLKSNEISLRKRENNGFDNDEWFQFSRNQGIRFEGISKLLCRDICHKSQFTYDINGDFYTTTTVYGYIKNKNIVEDERVFLAILNSSLMWYFMLNTGAVLANGYYRYMPRYVSEFPIPQLSPESQIPFIDLVDKILEVKKAGEDTQALEDEIDLRVFKLYELTHAEVLVIDTTFGMSEEEYEELMF
jgi:hypothetical protein